MAINKFQRSRLTLTFQPCLSYWSPINILTPSFFQKALGQLNAKFHIETPYDKSAKFYTKRSGHMAAMPMYGKKPLFFSEPEGL